MKKTVLLIAFACLIMANEKSADLSWVDQEIAAIKPPRKGISNRTISMLRDPFVFLKKNKEKDEKEKKAPQTLPSVVPSVTKSCAVVTPKRSIRSKALRLLAIINNSALINDKWYKVGEKIGKYKIIKVTLNQVTLQSPSRTLTLTTYTNKLKK